MAHKTGVIKRISSTIALPTTITNNNNNSISNNNCNMRMDADDVAVDDTLVFSRTCILGCQVNKLALCRFPVHDPKRCTNWLKFFDISAERVDSLGGLKNLRVCLKHFNQKQQMAKTRIKTTPTRLQKDTLAAAVAVAAGTTTTTTAAASNAAAATRIIAIAKPNTNATTIKIAAPTTTTGTTTTTVAANGYEVQKIKRQTTNGTIQLAKTQTQNGIATTTTSTLMPPKRTASISSASSTISLASETQSNGSDSEQNTIPAAINSNIKTNGNLLSKLNANGKRKVYMITEKCDTTMESTSADQTHIQAKRKMYLIMEEQNGDITNKQNGNENNGNGNGNAANNISQEDQQQQQLSEGTRKKLTLITDKCAEGKFEQILPEILSCIQQQQQQQQKHTQNGATQQNGVGHKLEETEAQLLPQLQQRQQQQQQQQQISRPAITLPPKKNRTKITDAAASQANHQSIVVVANNNNNNNDSNKTTAISSATPVIVKTVNATATDCATLEPLRRSNGQQQTLAAEKQINLSSDFLFLMKMLPKLECIPEPQKQQVKSCIESFINQSASRYEQY